MAKQGPGGISWTGRTWNCIRGCRRKNDDCSRCYAERLAATRLVNTPKYQGLAVLTPAGPRWTGIIRLDEHDLRAPLSWRDPSLVFVNAMSDLFYEDLTDHQIDRIVDVMAQARRHTFQVLTKRPDRMARYLPTAAARHTAADGSGWPLPNVWWGASMGHQDAVDTMMPDMERCRRHAAVLWVSAEPLLEALDWTPPEFRGTNVNRNDWLHCLDWMVGGAESDGGTTDPRLMARPTPLAAARKLRDDCDGRRDMGRPWPLPFQWKQWGEWIPAADQIGATMWERTNAVGSPARGRLWRGSELLFKGKEFDSRGDIDGGAMIKVGKKAAGRLLDGKVWDEYPRGFTPPTTKGQK